MSNCTIRWLLRLRKNTRICAATLSPSATMIGTSQRMLGIAGVDGPSTSRRSACLAAAVAHMRQDVDRRVGDELDVVGAAGERAFDIAGIVDLEEIQHALAVKSSVIRSFSAGVGPALRLVSASANSTAIVPQKESTRREPDQNG